MGNNYIILPRHIVGSISSNTSLPVKFIGSINIFDKYTFVEVPIEYAKEVLIAMKNNKINDKKVNIEVATKKQ